MSVYPSRTIFTHHEFPPEEDGLSILPAWLLATVLITFFALVTLANTEPFHYEGAGRHVAVAALVVAYLLAWKEVFRRYIA